MTLIKIIPSACAENISIFEYKSVIYGNAEPFCRRQIKTICLKNVLQSGPKGLNYSGLFTSDFLRSTFAMLIYTLVAWTPLLSATLRQRVGQGNFSFETRTWVNNSISQWTKNKFQCCKQMNGVKKRRRSNNFRP